MRMRPVLMRTLMTGALVLATSAAAHADATVFIGATTTPASRLTRGLTLGASLLIVGFEFEYSNAVEDPVTAAPSLTTGMGNVYAQTPFGAIQFYLLAGAGLYRERLDEVGRTGTTTAIGGGAKVGLAGPLRIRIDYRAFNLHGSPRHTRVHRVYTGLNFLF